MLNLHIFYHSQNPYRHFSIVYRVKYCVIIKYKYLIKDALKHVNRKPFFIVLYL